MYNSIFISAIIPSENPLFPSSVYSFSCMIQINLWTRYSNIKMYIDTAVWYRSSMFSQAYIAKRENNIIYISEPISHQMGSHMCKVLSRVIQYEAAVFICGLFHFVSRGLAVHTHTHTQVPCWEYEPSAAVGGWCLYTESDLELLLLSSHFHVAIN